MFDYLIKNGKYPDFNENEMKSGNIGIKDGKIAYVGNDEPEAERVIDADGLIVSPGFIDIHMHEEDFENEGLEYFVARKMLEMGVTTALGGNCGRIRQPIAQFKKGIEDLGGSPINYMLQTGYNYYRTLDGLGPYDPTGSELHEKIIQEMKKDIEDGAIGISFGIEYDPVMTTEEMIDAINKTISDPHMLCSAHFRADAIDALESVKEMIHITDSIPMKFQISHLSSCAAFNGIMEECLEEINSAMERNPRLNYDTYPYNAFQTRIGSAVYEDGCFDRWPGKSYGDVMLKDEPYKDMFCTKEIFEDARKNYPNMLAVGFSMDEEAIQKDIANKNGMIGSDGSMRANNGHPRAAGTFPRVLGKYVREEKIISLIDALRKMTITPAERLELDYKGRILYGCDADLTIFNPETIIDKATFDNMHQRPEGIEYVFVGGHIAVDRNETVNERLGKFISFDERH